MADTFVITKWCASITDSGKDEYTKKSHDGMPYKFRLLDDDGEIYAYGYSLTNDDDDAFNPLDHYESSYGVTMIEYFNCESKEWEML